MTSRKMYHLYIDVCGPHSFMVPDSKMAFYVGSSSDVDIRKYQHRMKLQYWENIIKSLVNAKQPITFNSLYYEYNPRGTYWANKKLITWLLTYFVPVVEKAPKVTQLYIDFTLGEAYSSEEAWSTDELEMKYLAIKEIQINHPDIIYIGSSS